MKFEEQNGNDISAIPQRISLLRVLRASEMSKRPANRYELITCALQHHVTVGGDVALVRSEDSLVVREFEGLRWCRCLRCDAWLPGPPPVAPSAEHLGELSEIE